MRLVRISASSDTGRFYYAGETKKEAEDNGLKYFLGSECKRGHIYFCDNGEKTTGCVRILMSGGCVKCNYIKAKESRHRDEKTEENSAAIRNRIEDIKLATELGISVDDL